MRKFKIPHATPMPEDPHMGNRQNKEEDKNDKVVENTTDLEETNPRKKRKLENEVSSKKQKSTDKNVFIGKKSEEEELEDCVSLPGSDIEDDLDVLLNRTDESDLEKENDSDKETEDVFSLTEDITKMLKEGINQDKVSESLNKDLTPILKELWTQKTGNKKKIKDKLLKISRPDNCAFFKTQKINEDIYSRLRKDVTATDKRLQKSQTFLTVGAIQVANIIDTLMHTKVTVEKIDDVKRNIAKIKEAATDAFTMLSYMKNGMVQYRKDKICRSLGKNIRSLRNIHEPDSKELFGDNVLNKIKDIRKQFKAITPNDYYKDNATTSKYNKQYSKNRFSHSHNYQNQRGNRRGGRNRRGSRGRQNETHNSPKSLGNY